MAVEVLNGNTLGEKHKNYNKLLKEASQNKGAIGSAEINRDQCDVENLLNVDRACFNRDVEYILKVLESDDMLYVSRVIQKSTWLITEKQYAHIINPEFLQSQIFPRMTTKAKNKLLKHIRLNLKEEARVEEFYRSEKNKDKAVKWLPSCSVAFIESNIAKHASDLKPQLFNRLCEKSITIFEVIIKENPNSTLLEASKFLLNTNMDKYLDVIEQLPYYAYPRFGARATELMMKKSPDRIINKFEHYVNIDIPTFAKYIKKEEIKGFLYNLADKRLSEKFNNLTKFFRSDKLLHLIKRIPERDRYEFVKTVFIDKLNISEIAQEPVDPYSELYRMQKLHQVVRLKKYYWYQFAPFEIAFTEIKKLIQSESSHDEKCTMLTILLTCAGKNLQNVKTLLQYYNDTHINDPFTYKYEFVSKVLDHLDIHKYDQNIWHVLDEIFKNMDVYVKSNNDVQNCVRFIIMYNILQNVEIPTIIKNKFSYVTFKTYYNKLKQDEREKVFCFLYNHLLTKIQNQNITTEAEFNETKAKLENVLTLLIDWKKNILDYPSVLDEIKELIKIRTENSWKISLSSLYNVEKSWRKYMFEESVLLCPSEDVCLNALKHDPGLLTRYKGEVETICNDDAVSVRRVLSKLRVYWPRSLATEWADAYLGRLNTLGGHKALIRGLCALLPQKLLMDIIKKYAPKINWSEIDELNLSLQKHIAKNMHSARPQPIPEAVLWYAKGDYLQYALPSVLAIFYNLNIILTRDNIQRLLNAPVSLQKHGIRLAFVKLEPEELKSVFLNIWKSSKNASIRSEIFKFTFDLLCNVEDCKKVDGFWELLELFIDNLTFEEDKKIYELLSEVDKVPINVRAKFLMKSYKFLQRLLPHVMKEGQHYEWVKDRLAESSREVMEFMCPDFVTDIILEFIDKKFFTYDDEYGRSINASDGMIAVISAYLLCSKDVESQTQKYHKILLPLIQRSFSMWEETRNGKYFIRQHFQELLNTLCLDLKEYTIKKNMIIPHKMYSDIQTELKSLLVSENYLMLTMWKLTTSLTNLLHKYNASGEWEDICSKIRPEFEELCVAYLKEDVKSYFPCIYVIFSKALNNAIKDLMHENVQLKMYEHMLSHKDFVQAYLVTINLLPRYQNSDEAKAKAAEIQKRIFEHPSIEIKMHYYNKFKDENGCGQCMGGYA